MKLIILNSSNFVANEGNLYTYVLPSSVKFESGTKVGISSMSIFSSVFNKTAALGNNTINFRWNANSGGQTINIVIPDGYYNVSDLNGLLQFYMFQNGWYMTKTNGDIVYFFEILQNATRYAIQLNKSNNTSNHTGLFFTRKCNVFIKPKWCDGIFTPINYFIRIWKFNRI